MVRIENPLEHSCQISAANGELLPTISNSFITRYPEAYKRQFNNFINLITRKQRDLKQMLITFYIFESFKADACYVHS